MTDWCILRTGGSRTLQLSHSLAMAGFEVWSPVELQVRRNGGARTRTERMVAVMPTYVFARATHLPDLVEASLAPVSPHPDFSVFRFDDRYPLIDDRELSHLRAIERMAAVKKKPVVFETGTSVRAHDGPFEGLTGRVVETSKGQFTLVAFPRFNIPVKFSTWQLGEIPVEQASPEQGELSSSNAARAA